MPSILGLDSETTGVDLRHAACPFLVTLFERGENTFWEWDVDPLTRQPVIPKSDVREIEQRLEDAEEIVGQNIKFDIAGLVKIGVRWRQHWWVKTHDTLFAAHLIASGEPHDLTTLALKHLRIDILSYEQAVLKAATDCRTLARRDFPKWLIAHAEGLPGFPSMKKSKGIAKNDMWLLRQVAKAKGYPETHPYWTLTADYANTDSTVVVPIFERQRAELQAAGLWGVYLERRKLIEAIYKMESAGLTYSEDRMNRLKKDFTEKATIANSTCINLSQGKLDSLPASGTTKAMRTLLFDEWKMPVVARSEKTNEPSVDKNVLAAWSDTLPRNSRQLKFVENLIVKRKADTTTSYIGSYERFSKPSRVKQYRQLYSSLNPTGTAHLRMSSERPNQQNVSKQEGWNIREGLGPLPDREWWALDYSNIELRIPAYEAQEAEMVYLFEHPDEPPYFGSYHMLVFDTLHPDLFAKHGMECKKLFESTWYQWTKNGNFAVQYGAVEISGTADSAYHVPGAQRRIQQRFGNIAKLNQTQIDHANRYGFVYTIPDKEYGTGYPIECSRSQWGGVIPTIPLNYHVSGTAMWCMCRALARCQDYLNKRPKLDVKIVLQVHDELVFDMPKGSSPQANLPVVKQLKSIMEASGSDIGIPLKVKANYHPDNWAHEVKYAMGA